jgi:hypothetical protein
VDHDISLLIPEVWSRMSEEERDPKNLVAAGCLERCYDFDYNGKTILASRLGHRITLQFVILYFGRIFNHPHAVCTPEMLRPEMQDMDVFVDGMANIVTTQQRVAENYFQDSTVDFACPPLRVLLHIMAKGHFEGKDLHHPEIRRMFTLNHLWESDWYPDRLRAKQQVDSRLWERHVNDLENFLKAPADSDGELLYGIKDRLEEARKQLAYLKSSDYLNFLKGSTGAQPL